MLVGLCAADKGYCRACRICSSEITLLWELFKARVSKIPKASLFPVWSHQIRHLHTSRKHILAGATELRKFQFKTPFGKRSLCDFENVFVQNVVFTTTF